MQIHPVPTAQAVDQRGLGYLLSLDVQCETQIGGGQCGQQRAFEKVGHIRTDWF